MGGTLTKLIREGSNILKSKPEKDSMRKLDQYPSRCLNQMVGTWIQRHIATESNATVGMQGWLNIWEANGHQWPYEWEEKWESHQLMQRKLSTEFNIRPRRWVGHPAGPTQGTSAARPRTTFPPPQFGSKQLGEGWGGTGGKESFLAPHGPCCYLNSTDHGRLAKGPHWQERKDKD